MMLSRRQQHRRQLFAAAFMMLVLTLLHWAISVCYLSTLPITVPSKIVVTTVPAPADAQNGAAQEETTIKPPSRSWRDLFQPSKQPERRIPPPPSLQDDDLYKTTSKPSISTSPPRLPSTTTVPQPPRPQKPNVGNTRDKSPVTTIMEMNDVESATAFYERLQQFEANLLKNIDENPDQPSKNFVDINQEEGKGSPVPFDPAFEERPERWEACDDRNASFSLDRDRLCQEYLGNLNNMRYVKAMSSKLLQGRTIKLKVTYAHNNIRSIIKISQRKFVYEAASEFWAFTFDRILQFNRVPTTAYIPLPLDYIRAGVAYSPLFSQWFHRSVVLYNYTQANFQQCAYPTREVAECTMASTQLWMKDVHPALETFLALPYELDENFVRKYYIPGNELFSGMKRARLRAIGELSDRSIFDFLIGNSDRGMNDHNNFVYGGCSERTECTVEKPENRIKGLAKFAYLDHGSSLYSHKEVEENIFAGSGRRAKVCRYRRSTYQHLLKYESGSALHYPLIKEAEKEASAQLYKVSYDSVIRKVQVRLDKIVRFVNECLLTYPESEVFSLPEYSEVRIAEEDATLGDEWD